MHVCPVCGYPELAEPPRSPAGGGSYEICPSCGFQFGVDDDDRGQTIEDAQKAWVTAGMPWSSRGIRPPRSWDAQRQLASLKPGTKSVKKSVGKATAVRAKKSVQAAKKKPGSRR